MLARSKQERGYITQYILKTFSTTNFVWHLSHIIKKGVEISLSENISVLLYAVRFKKTQIDNFQYKTAFPVLFGHCHPHLLFV